MKSQKTIYIMGLILLAVSMLMTYIPLAISTSDDVPYIAILWASFYLSLYAVEAGFIGFYHGRDCSGSKCSWLAYLLAPVLFLTTVWFTGIGGFDKIPDAVIRNAFNVPDLIAAFCIAVASFIIGWLGGAAARQAFYSLAFNHLVETASADYEIHKDELEQFSTVTQVANHIANKKKIDEKTIANSIMEKLKELGAGFSNFDENTDLKSFSIAATNPDEYLSAEFLRVALSTAEKNFGINAAQLNEQNSISEIAARIASLKSINKDTVEKSIIKSIASELSLKESQIDNEKVIK